MLLKSLSLAALSVRPGTLLPRASLIEFLRRGTTRPPPRIRTSRLILRRWVRGDRAAFARMNANPRVMQFLPGVLSREKSDAAFELLQAQLNEHGWGVWAMEIPSVTRFAGYVGLSRPRGLAHLTAGVEVSWHLDEAFWGRAYATEGALAALAFGFEFLGLREIVSVAPAAHIRARRVMERIGMDWDGRDDFDHPALPENHPLRHQVLYRKRVR